MLLLLRSFVGMVIFFMNYMALLPGDCKWNLDSVLWFGKSAKRIILIYRTKMILSYILGFGQSFVGSIEWRINLVF
jgi:hypothetical protein